MEEADVVAVFRESGGRLQAKDLQKAFKARFKNLHGAAKDAAKEELRSIVRRLCIMETDVHTGEKWLVLTEREKTPEGLAQSILSAIQGTTDATYDPESEEETPSPVPEPEEEVREETTISAGITPPSSPPQSASTPMARTDVASPSDTGRETASPEEEKAVKEIEKACEEVTLTVPSPTLTTFSLPGKADETWEPPASEASLSPASKASSSPRPRSRHSRRPISGDWRKETALDRGWLQLCGDMATSVAAARAELEKAGDKESLLRAACSVTGYTGLHWAAKTGNAALARFLFGSCPDLIFVSAQGLTPLHVAYLHGHGDLARQLEKDLVTERGSEALSQATRMRDYSGKRPADYASAPNRTPTLAQLHKAPAQRNPAFPVCRSLAPIGLDK